MGRLVLATLVLLPLFCGLLGFSLDKAFTSSVYSSQQAQLTLQTYSLIASAELEGTQLFLPLQFSEDRLNQASSDLFAVVMSSTSKKSIWRSNSAVDLSLPNTWHLARIEPGESEFGEVNDEQGSLFYLQYHVVWEGEQGVEYPFQFVVFERTDKLKQTIAAYRQSLWLWLGLIAASMVLLQVFILRWGLKPIQEVANDLNDIQLGKQNLLDGDYPIELLDMTTSINTLISHEAQQRQRYKNTLDNLAHSLKTPLSIMQGGLKSNKENQVEEIEEQINRIDQIVSYQLSRAVSIPQNPLSANVSIRDNCEKVTAALHKVYRDKAINVTMEISELAVFYGDKGDLLEILGNILDNAFKYGNGEIRISGERIEEKGFSLVIEDNGHGVDEQHRAKLLQRGQRADTLQPGQGIGLAVVTDIVSSYRGSIELNASELGGVAVSISI